MTRYKAAVWKPLTNRSTRTIQKDLCCWHTAVSSSLAGTWQYFEGGAGGRGVYSHGMIGGGWGADLRDGLDGVAWQMQDTDLRGAANLDGNWHVIAWETSDNAARPIAPWTPKQCGKIVEIMVEAYRVDGIPLELVPDSKPGRRGHAYHRLGCDPYRVDGGELWSSAYGKDCPTDPRIQQLPGLLDQARTINAGGHDMDLAEFRREIGATDGKSTRTALWELYVRAVNATLGVGERPDVDIVDISGGSPARKGVDDLIEGSTTLQEIRDAQAAQADQLARIQELLETLTAPPAEPTA